MDERPRRAAVSSFGISGTNAHVIIEEGDGEPARVPCRVMEEHAGVTAGIVHEWLSALPDTDLPETDLPVPASPTLVTEAAYTEPTPAQETDPA